MVWPPLQTYRMRSSGGWDSALYWSLQWFSCSLAQIWKPSLHSMPLKFSSANKSPRDLSEMQIPIQQVWGGGESAVLARSQVMPTLLVLEPHTKEEGVTEHLYAANSIPSSLGRMENWGHSFLPENPRPLTVPKLKQGYFHHALASDWLLLSNLTQQVNPLSDCFSTHIPSYASWKELQKVKQLQTIQGTFWKVWLSTPSCRMSKVSPPMRPERIRCFPLLTSVEGRGHH